MKSRRRNASTAAPQTEAVTGPSPKSPPVKNATPAISASGAARSLRLLLAAAVILLAAAAATAAEWRPEEWEDGSTLSFQTIAPDHSEQWSTVWYVVLSGDVYVRLGASAAEEIEQNVKQPYVKVRIGGKTFSDVRADPANDMANTVDEAMADKYPMDFLFRYLPHPMVVRLRAASFR